MLGSPLPRKRGAGSFVVGRACLVACPALRRWMVAGPPMADRATVDEGLLILG
jgi:hypothetical protein